jgi:hypothetical protein
VSRSRGTSQRGGTSPATWTSECDAPSVACACSSTAGRLQARPCIDGMAATIASPVQCDQLHDHHDDAADAHPRSATRTHTHTVYVCVCATPHTTHTHTHKHASTHNRKHEP